MLAALILFAGMTASSAGPMTASQLAVHARAAEDAEKQGNFSAAVQQYRILAKELPQNAEIQSNMGVALYLNHELPEAIAVFSKAIALQPEFFTPHLFSGLAWYRLSKPGLAAPELEKAVRLKPSDPLAHLWLGYSYTALSKNMAALKEFEAASRLDPGNVDALYQLGEAWLQVGQDATAKLLAAAPDGGRAWELAGEQAQLRGDHPKALSDFEQAEARRPDIPELRELIAGLGGKVTAASAEPRADRSEEDTLYRQAKDAEQNSRAALERVIQLAPDSYRAHQIMASSFVLQGQDDKAIEEYRTVLELQPGLAGIHQAIGSALVRSGKLPDALKEYDAELQVQPHSASAAMNRGRVLLLMGKDAEAEKSLTAVLGMDRPPAETYVLLARIDLRRKDYEKAARLLEHYVSNVKGNSTAYYMLAMAYRNLGNREKMKNYLALYKQTSRDAKERR